MQLKFNCPPCLQVKFIMFPPSFRKIVVINDGHQLFKWSKTMSARLPIDKIYEIEEKLNEGLSVLRISKEVKVSRNTIKKYFAHRTAGTKKELYVESIAISPKDDILPMETVLEEPLIERYQFTRLVKLFKEYKSSSDPLDPYSDVVGLTRQIGREIGVNALADIVRLETAIEYNMVHRFTMIRTFELMTKLYDPTWEKNAYLMSRNVKIMMETCTNCSGVYLQILRELEVKYGRRIPDKVMGNLIINRNSINVDNRTL